MDTSEIIIPENYPGKESGMPWHWLNAPTMFEGKIFKVINNSNGYIIKKSIEDGHGGRTPDGKYETFPSNTLVKCKVFEDGKELYDGKEIFARIVDPREFYDTVHYWVEAPLGSGKMCLTRSEFISWPVPTK